MAAAAARHAAGRSPQQWLAAVAAQVGRAAAAMGLAGPSIDSAGSSTGFSFFYLINRGGQQSASENRSFIVTFDPR
jgi:hypothetical protein